MVDPYNATMSQDETIEILASGKFMQMVRDGRWEYVRRHTCDGAVAILATTEVGEVVLVEQHRVPMGCPCLELPAGLVGDTEADQGEAMLVAAERELLEETGYTAKSMEHLFPFATSPGLSNEVIDLFRATGLSKTHDGGGVGNEDITVHLVKADKLDDWLAEQRAAGFVIDMKVYYAAALLKHL